MVETLQFFTDNAVWIILLLILAGIFAFREVIRASREKRQAVFALELELATRHTRQSVAIFIIVVMLVFLQMTVVLFLEPILPALSVLNQPTGELGKVPTRTIPPEILQTLMVSTPLATPTMMISGCIPDQIMLTSPSPGQEIRGKITLQGTADIPNFGFYKYEFSMVGSNLWSTVQAGREPRRNEDLGSWDTSELSPGDYLLQLIVTDNKGDMLPACIVPVRIALP